MMARWADSTSRVVGGGVGERVQHGAVALPHRHGGGDAPRGSAPARCRCGRTRCRRCPDARRPAARRSAGSGGGDRGSRRRTRAATARCAASPRRRSAPGTGARAAAPRPRSGSPVRRPRGCGVFGALQPQSSSQRSLVKQLRHPARSRRSARIDSGRRAVSSIGRARDFNKRSASREIASSSAAICWDPLRAPEVPIAVKTSGDWAISRQPRLGGRALRGHTPPTRPVRPRVKRWSRPQRRRRAPEAGESRCGRLIPWFWVRVPGGPYTGVTASPHGLAVRTPPFQGGDRGFESRWGY